MVVLTDEVMGKLVLQQWQLECEDLVSSILTVMLFILTLEEPL